jgi:hypothetical protein
VTSARLSKRLLIAAAFVAASVALSWLLGYVLFWLLIQRVPVDFRFFWYWLRLAVQGGAGEAPGTVALLAEITFVSLMLVAAAVWRGRRARGDA